VTLRALADAGAQNPELRDYYEFHRALLETLNQARADISGVLPRVLPTRAEDGSSDCPTPLLSFDDLPVEGERFVTLVTTVARSLAEYDPSFEGQGVPSSPAQCLRLARQRFEEGWACGEQSPSHGAATLAQLSVDLALRPYLQWGAQQLREHVGALGAWRRGYCPICGGAPDFASLDEASGARRLLCSRCDTQWPYHRLGCPFCGTTDHTRLSYYSGDDQVYRLYVCEECQRYLKTIDLRHVQHTVLLPLERVTSVAMDAAALEAGYR